MAACDEVDDSAAQREVLIGMAPRVEITIELSEANEAVAREVEEVLSIATPAAEPWKKLHAPTDARVRGWITWAMAQPWYTGPIGDPTGEQCAVGQQDSVWYLAGTTGGPAVRECSIPAGKKLFFPLINRSCVFPGEFYPDEDAIAADMPFILDWYEYERANTCELTLRLDGQDLLDFETMHEELYIQLDELFELELHEEHWAPDLFGGGVMPASGAGHYAQIQPLAPGDHVLEFGGSTCGEYPFETHVTYLLHVGPH